MISEDSVYKIGYISKTHGLKGEVNFHFTDDIFDTTESPYLLIRVDGIIVPFFIESIRFRSDTTAIVKFEQINSSEQAQMLLGNDVLFERSKASADGAEELTLQYFIGFSVVDEEGETKGVITDVDDQTENWLFQLEAPDGTVHYIPAHEEFIVSMDHDEKRMVMNLPEGIWEL